MIQRGVDVLKDPRVFAERVALVYRDSPASLVASFVVSSVIMRCGLAESDGAGALVW